MAIASKWIEATPDEPVTDVAVRCIELRLEPIREILWLAAYEADEDVEYVHQLRVSCRRAQTALGIFREFVPAWRVAWMDEQLKRIRKATNDARDDDVFMMRLAEDQKDPGAARLLKRVRQHRRDAQQKVIDVYRRMKKKDRLERRSRKLAKRVRMRRDDRGRKPPAFGKWANRRMQDVLGAFHVHAKRDLADIESLHRFRITGKQLRYTIELLAGAFPRSLRVEVYPQLVSLQDRLGEVNDRAVACDRIQNWIDEDPSSKESAYLHRCLAEEEQSLSQSHEDFLQWWDQEERTSLFDAFDQALGAQ